MSVSLAHWHGSRYAFFFNTWCRSAASSFGNNGKNLFQISLNSKDIQFLNNYRFSGKYIHIYILFEAKPEWPTITWFSCSRKNINRYLLFFSSYFYQVLYFRTYGLWLLFNSCWKFLLEKWVISELYRINSFHIASKFENLNHLQNTEKTDTWSNKIIKQKKLLTNYFINFFCGGKTICSVSRVLLNNWKLFGKCKKRQYCKLTHIL